MAEFGRDSLVASYQAMLHVPALAKKVLGALARLQGRKDDAETGEAPGKILHENRPPGLRGARRVVPRFPYYGSVDATPLYVIVMHEYWRRTGDDVFVREHAGNLAAAVGWIQRAAEAGSGGLLRYERRGSLGLRN